MLRFIRRGPENRQAIGDLPPYLSAILRNRGVDTAEKAERFLHPSLAQLSDPFLMQGMEKAVRLIRQAVTNGDAIQVYGDYDVDGVCATVIMMETLRAMGADAAYRIPSRHGEGYGLSLDAVREMAKTRKLLITVDCGVTNHEEVALARELGMTVIVTDHHQLAPTPSPADVTLNPLLGDYPFRRLCGAGVALKLCQALLGDALLEGLLEIAALATVADVVPLVEENRVIVSEGLKRLASTKRPGLAMLKREAGVEGEVSSTQVAFRLAPRINAGGRMEDADQCVRLLLTRDESEAASIAAHLEEQNQRRQAMQSDMLRQAEEKLRADMDFRDDLVIVVMGEGWNSGVIGLVAGRLCEKYHFPVVVLSRQDDLAVGSCRSIPGVNIHAMLSACSDLFLRFGGHEQAAGLTMRADLVGELRRRLSLNIRKTCDLRCYIPVREYDAVLPLGAVDLDLVDALYQLQPTGFGNPAPAFLTCGAQVQQARRVGREGQHLKLSLLEGTALRDGIAFQQGDAADQGLETVDVLYAPEKNEFRGQVTAQLQVQALLSAEGSAALPPEERFFESLLQEITCLAENLYPIRQPPDSVSAAGVEKLLGKGRGVLLLSHTPRSAREIAPWDNMDVCEGALRDPRAFNTLLCAPDVEALRDEWRHIILLDGDVLDGEAGLIASRCPRAEIHAMKPNGALREVLQSLAMPDEPLRTLYRRLRQGGDVSAAALARDTGLTEPQVLFGLRAFAQVRLVRFTPRPYRVELLKPVKCSMEDSAVIRYARERARRA